jgi:hypothetical protein
MDDFQRVPQNATRNGRKIQGIVRMMTNIERIFYLVPGYTIPLAIRIEGPVDAGRLQAAFAEVQRRHPLLSARIVFDDLHRAWFVNQGVKPVDFSVVQRRSPTHWYEVVKHEMKVPFRPHEQPMIRLALVQGETESDLLILSGHSISDGMSLVIILRDLLTAYARPGRLGEPVPPLGVTDLLPPRTRFSLKGILTALYARYGNSRWRRHAHRFAYEDYLAVNTDFWQTREFNMLLLEFDPEESAALHERCHARGVSIGSAVTTAAIAARQEIRGPFTGYKRTVSIPYEMRRHSARPVADIVGQCSGMVDVTFTYDAKRSFWENAAVLNQGVKAHVSRF